MDLHWNPQEPTPAEQHRVGLPAQDQYWCHNQQPNVFEIDKIISQQNEKLHPDYYLQISLDRKILNLTASKWLFLS